MDDRQVTAAGRDSLVDAVKGYVIVPDRRTVPQEIATG
jgi:hypothetical protein